MELYDLQAEMKTIKSLLDSPNKVKEKLYSKTDLSLFGYEVSQEIYKRIQILSKAGKKLSSSDTFKHDAALSEEAKTFLEGIAKPIKNSADVSHLIDGLNNYKKYRAINSFIKGTIKTCKKKKIDLRAVAKNITGLAKVLEDVEELPRLADIKHKAPKPPVPLRPEALHGLMGDIVKYFEPYTEAHPAGMLFLLCTMSGNYIGRGPHAKVGFEEHFLNFFNLTIGDSGAGKGQSESVISPFFKKIDPDYIKSCIHNGVSTGEGLIRYVQDEVLVKRKNKQGNWEEVVKEFGVEDKRAVVIDEEFNNILNSNAKLNATLGGVLKKSWDGPDELKVGNATNPYKATDPHISIVGHIITDELLSGLTSLDMMNGFANRFLYTYVERTKDLDEGGEIASLNLDKHIQAFKNIFKYIKHQNKIGNNEVKRSKNSERIWKKFCKKWRNVKHSGVLNSITKRARPQVLRLSTLRALMDGSFEVKTQHLNAAIAMWDYSFDTAKFVFGETSGDSFVEEIKTILEMHPLGMTFTDILKFKYNRDPDKIRKAINSLMINKLIKIVPEKRGKRNVDVYYLIPPEEEKEINNKAVKNIKFNIDDFNKRIEKKIKKLNSKKGKYDNDDGEDELEFDELLKKYEK
jgi:hypothetical protein